MKKAIVLLLALVAIGGFVFAEDAAAAPVTKVTISGDATAKWIFDIDASDNYFANSYSIGFAVDLVGKNTVSKAGEGTYGKIDIKDLRLVTKKIETLDEVTPAFDTTDMDISASIISGALTVGIFGKPSASYNNAVAVPDFKDDADPLDLLKPKLSTTGGIKIGYSLGDLGSVTLSAASYTKDNVAAVPAGTSTPASTVVIVATATAPADVAGVTYYDFAGNVVAAGALVAGTSYIKSTTATTGTVAVDATTGKHYYLGGVDVSLKPVKDVVAVTAGVWYDPELKALAGTGKVSVTAGDLGASVASDLKKVDTADLEFDLGAHLGYSLFEKKDSINADFYYTKAASVPGHEGDVSVTFVDAGGLVAPLSFTLGVLVDDLMGTHDDTQLSIGTSASYKVELSDATSVKPYGTFKVDMSGKKKNYIKAGVEGKLITNVTLDANIEMGAEVKDINHNLAADSTANKFTLSAKVSY